jgi:hypothetical protein
MPVRFNVRHVGRSEYEPVPVGHWLRFVKWYIVGFNFRKIGMLTRISLVGLAMYIPIGLYLGIVEETRLAMAVAVVLIVKILRK